jgi:hypothetical protein
VSLQAVFKPSNQQQQQSDGDDSDHPESEGGAGGPDDSIEDLSHDVMSDDSGSDVDPDPCADAAAGRARTGKHRRAAAAANGSNAAAAAAGSSDGSDEEGGDLDPERVLLYERSKLRWYYAVVECVDANTAAAIYEACDGIEFERSASKFDLRCAVVCGGCGVEAVVQRMGC